MEARALVTMPPQSSHVTQNENNSNHNINEKKSIKIVLFPMIIVAILFSLFFFLSVVSALSPQLVFFSDPTWTTRYEVYHRIQNANQWTWQINWVAAVGRCRKCTNAFSFADIIEGYRRHWHCPTQILAEPTAPYTPMTPYCQCQQHSIYGWGFL